MERYVSLNLKLAKANEWALFGVLDDVEIPGRLKQLELRLLEHSRHYDDLGSAKLVEYIMTTVTDEQILPFALGVIREGEEFLQLDQTKWEEIGEASCVAVINRAQKAMELFPKLPIFKPVKKFGYRDDDRNVPYDYVGEEPTLINTKEALLFEVAKGWRTTRDEIGADTFFDFIRTAKLHCDDGKMRAEVIRKVTDAGFPVYRLVHTLARFFRELKDNDKIIEILAQGWVRYANKADLEGVFHAIEPLSQLTEIPGSFSSKTASAEAFDFVRRTAVLIKTVDDKVQQMLAKVGSRCCTVEYSHEMDWKTPTVSLTFRLEVEDENSGHKLFGSIRDAVEKWLRENGNQEEPRLWVKLKLLANRRWEKSILVERGDLVF